MKKLARRIVIAALAAAAAISMVGCQNQTDTPEPTLTGIAVTTPPTKTVYVIGEDFAPAGMVVTATYDDGSTREVPHGDLAFSGFDSASAGQRTVTVTYREKTATFAVMVNAPEITIDTQPEATTTVIHGSITGSLAVAASVTGGGTVEWQWFEAAGDSNVGGAEIGGATSASFAIPDDLEIGTHFFFAEARSAGAVSVRTEVAAVTVMVIELTGIAVTTPPTKRLYAPGEEFAPAGMVVSRIYSDGSTAAIPSGELTIADPEGGNIRLGSRLVTIAWQGMETTWLVAVDDTVEVEGGTFRLGEALGAWTPNPDATPVSNVTLTTFRMARHTVTQDEWRAVMAGNANGISYSPSHFGNNPHSGEEQGRRPVEMVNWYMAIVYANRLSVAAGLTPAYSLDGSTDTETWGAAPLVWDSTSPWNSIETVPDSTGFRLPTEAQWEFAAKGGNEPGDFAFSGSDDPDEVAWHLGNSGSITREVGGRDANALGIYDMSGNVWEWIWDWWGAYTSEDKTDPAGATSGSDRVMRGGSSSETVINALSARRDRTSPATRFRSTGFRLARPQD